MSSAAIAGTIIVNNTVHMVSSELKRMSIIWKDYTLALIHILEYESITGEALNSNSFFQLILNYERELEF